MQPTLASIPRHIEIRQFAHTDSALVLEGYALLQEAMGTDGVENLGSFMDTVSPMTDPQVTPIMVCALNGGGMAGIIVGAYLKALNMGFIAYSGVKDKWRRRGIYTAMRRELIERFSFRPTGNRFDIAPNTPGIDIPRIDYVISELDGDGWLYNKYVRDWGAYVLPCDYEQPEAQGLTGKRMNLVLQPLAKKTPPDRAQTAAIVREVYGRIYRISDVDANPAFRRVIASTFK